MKKLIVVLIFVACAITGCRKWEHVQFVENDITIDGHTQTVTFTATHRISPNNICGYYGGHYLYDYSRKITKETINGRTFSILESEWCKVMSPLDDKRTLYVQIAENDTSTISSYLTNSPFRDSINLKLGRNIKIECIDLENSANNIFALIRQLPLSNEQ